VLVLHDISTLRHLEMVRRDFVANVSHELKTPLAAIRGLAETILEDDSMASETRRDFLERVRLQTLRLSTMVEEVLVVSRLESDDHTVELLSVDAVEHTREAVQALLPLAEERKVDVQMVLPEGRLSVLATEEALRRIVGNLVDNGIKYTPSGGHVWVRLRREGERVLLEVEDDGIGIPPESRERVFERFYRVDPGRSRAAGGTGLGLSIVKHLVQALGGEVWLEPVPIRGSIFRVRFRPGDRTPPAPRPPR
jgi:two-component system phosphate regulon sensor histidine kinase PhoR